MLRLSHVEHTLDPARVVRASYARARGYGPFLWNATKADPITYAAWLVVLIASVRCAWLFFEVCARRVAFRYDLEWMEGGMVEHMVRVLRGQPIYVEPSFDFVPFIYNPLFYWLGAGASLFVGVGPVALRSIAVLSTVGLTWILVELVRRESKSLKAGIVAGACFLATYELSGGWMDIARADTTFLALEAAAVLRVRSGTRRAAIESGVLMLLAFLAKQYALVCVFPILAYLLLDRGIRVAAWFAGTVVVCVGTAMFWLNYSTDGWYWFWTVQLPSLHGSNHLSLGNVVRDHVLTPLPLLCAVAIVGAAQQARHALFDEAQSRRHQVAAPVLHLGFAAVLLVQAWTSYNHTGSFLNCLMPGHVALALLAGFAMDSTKATSHASATLTALVALSVQLYLLAYSPARWIPNEADTRETALLEQGLKETKGSLYPFRGFYGAEGLNPAHAHQMGIVDLFKAGEHFPELRARLNEQAELRYQAKEFPEVVLDNWDYVFLPALQRHYRMTSQVPLDRGSGWTPSGARMKPRVVFVPRGAGAP